MQQLSGQQQLVSKSNVLIALITILVLSFTLNVMGNKWGAPANWHPDELVERATRMSGDRTLNPHAFPYGGLPHYVLMAGAIMPAKVTTYYFDPRPDAADTAATASWMQRLKTQRIILSRTISGLFATALVLMTFLMGRILFSELTGLIAALFLAVSPYFVGIAHFATVDMPGNFLYWLACLIGLYVWKRGHNLWYALAAVTLGLAIGTKVDRLVAVLPLLLSHLFRGKGLQSRKLLLFGLLVPCGYIIANPTLIFSFFEFVDGTTRDLFFNIVRGEPGETSYLKLISDIMSGMGAPLFIAAACGIGYAVYNLIVDVDRPQTVWLLSAIIPYYLIFGSRLSTAWYVPILFPALALFAAYGCSRIIQLAGRWRIMSWFIVLAVAAPSFMYSLAIDMQLSNDARYQAARWIDENVPVNSTVELSSSGPVIAHDQYRVIYRPKDPADYKFARKWRDKLETHEGYQKLSSNIHLFEQWLSQNYGLQQRSEPYLAWFDRVPGVIDNRVAIDAAVTGVDDETIAGLPDYKVFTSRRDLSVIPQIQGYEHIAEFKKVNPFGLEIQLQFVNPGVHIYQLKNQP